MSFVLAAPEALTAAASDLAGIGSTITSAHAAAAAPTTGIVAAAADEVSTQIATLFSQHGQGFHRLSAQAAAYHEQFVQALSAGASKYAAAEANAAQTLVNAVNAPAEKILGHPLIGTGTGVVSGGIARGLGLLGTGSANLFGGGGVAASLLALRPTGGLGALSALGGLLRTGGITNAGVSPVALAGGSIAANIKGLYNFFEPYVRYGFELAQYVVGYIPWVGILAPQILFLYDWIEPMVQSGLFNILDWVTGSISFSTGLSQFFDAVLASTGAFIHTETQWILSFLPNLPPLPPLPPWPFG